MVPPPPLPDSYSSFPNSNITYPPRFPFPPNQYMSRFQYSSDAPQFYPPFNNSLLGPPPPMQQQMPYSQTPGDPSYLSNQMPPVAPNARPRSFAQQMQRPRHSAAFRGPRPHGPRPRHAAPAPISSPDSQKLVADSVTDPSLTLVPQGSGGARLYHCTLCSVNCNSLQMWESHVVGRKHTHQVKLLKGSHCVARLQVLTFLGSSCSSTREQSEMCLLLL